MDNRENRNAATVVLSIALCLCLYLSTYASFFLNSSDESVNATEPNNTVNFTVNETVVKKVFVPPPQPITHISYMHTHILPDILHELYLKVACCTPEDIYNEAKHRVPKVASKTAKTGEPPAMVVYIAMGLLLTSLGAAVIDFFRAKTEMKMPDAKKKPSLTRRCSLADLTVLRHSRKESMRKDSIYDGSPASSKAIGRKVSRPPLRLE